MSKTVLLIGTLDTKGREYAYVRDLIRARGLNTFVLDAGVLGEPVFTPDSPASLTAEAGGGSLAELREKRDRGHALEIMGLGARALALKLLAEGKFDGVISMGGSGGTSIGTHGHAGAPGGHAQADRLDHGLGRRGPVRRRQGHHDDVLRRRRLRAQPPVPPHLRQRRRRHRRHGRADDAEGRGEAARRRHDVRRHDAVRRPCPRADWRQTATRCSSSTRSAAAAAPSRR